MQFIYIKKYTLKQFHTYRYSKNSYYKIIKGKLKPSQTFFTDHLYKAKTCIVQS